jgi:type VI protein secretion system component Hcp
MKKVAFLLIMFVSALSSYGQAAQLSPGSIQIPQVSGTNSVANPTNGMLIYNISDQSLYYRKESEWVKINNTLNSTVASTTNIYYKITTSGSNPAVPGEITTGPHTGQTKINYLDYDLSSTVEATGAGAGSGKTIVSPVTISRPRGPNSIPFLRAIATGKSFDTIEFLFYNDSDQLFYSIKLTAVFVKKIGKSEFDGSETDSFIFQKIGWKDYSQSPAVVGTFDLVAYTFTSTY